MSSFDAKLLIVYNAQSGLVTAALHALHKAFKPETYPCSLCALTYGAVSMHGKWRSFLKGLPVDTVFHHSDDFVDEYPQFITHDLPAIFLREKWKSPRVLISAEDLNAMASLDDLMDKLEKRLAIYISI